MRVLVTCFPGLGHLDPLLPVARALRAAGHEVRLATGATLAGAVRAAGLEHLPAGIAESRMAPGGDGMRLFAEVAAPAMVRDVLAAAREAPPERIVHEEGEWGGPVAAAVLGVPSVAVGWGAPPWTDAELQRVDALTRPLWERHGRRPRTPGGLFDFAYLDRCPPSLRGGGPELPRVDVRHEPRIDVEATGRPQVYVTLGTVPAFNRAPALLHTIAQALAAEAVSALVTVGPGGDVAALPPLPGVRVEQFVPQAEALARSVAAVTHGGAGSTLGALAAGLPVLVLPRGAPSQARMARACAAAGAGVTLAADEVSPPAVRAAIRRLLHDDGLRARARALREEIRAMPPATEAVAAITAERR